VQWLRRRVAELSRALFLSRQAEAAAEGEAVRLRRALGETCGLLEQARRAAAEKGMQLEVATRAKGRLELALVQNKTQNRTKNPIQNRTRGGRSGGEGEDGSGHEGHEPVGGRGGGGGGGGRGGRGGGNGAEGVSVSSLRASHDADRVRWAETLRAHARRQEQLMHALAQAEACADVAPSSAARAEKNATCDENSIARGERVEARNRNSTTRAENSVGLFQKSSTRAGFGTWLAENSAALSKNSMAAPKNCAVGGERAQLRGLRAAKAAPGETLLGAAEGARPWEEEEGQDGEEEGVGAGAGLDLESGSDSGADHRDLFLGSGGRARAVGNGFAGSGKRGVGDAAGANFSCSGALRGSPRPIRGEGPRAIPRGALEGAPGGSGAALAATRQGGPIPQGGAKAVGARARDDSMHAGMQAKLKQALQVSGRLLGGLYASAGGV
jgi:hypothetical protein